MDTNKWFQAFTSELQRRTGIDTSELDQDYFVATYYPDPPADAVTDHITQLRKTDPDNFPELDGQS